MSLLRSFVFLSAGLCALLWASLAAVDRREMSRRSNPLASWSVPTSDPVVLHVENSVHYALDTEEGIAEFASLMPSGGHLVHIGEETLSPYTVTMFHQLRCLDIIREDYISEHPRPRPELTRHCMNYLRQMFLCHPNLRLESVRYPIGPKSTTSQPYEVVCRDWTAVYAEAERNQEAYLLRSNSSRK